MQPIVVDPELELRLLALQHAPELFALTEANRAHLRAWLPWLDSIRVVTDTEGFIAKTMRIYADTKAFVAGIWWRDRLVGVIGHNRIDWDNSISSPGYWLAGDVQGRGIMTRCTRALVQHAFDTLLLNRVEICVAVGNHRSRAIPVRLGFTHEGIRREGEHLYDRYIDLVVFGMIKSSWQLQNSLSRT